MKIGVMGCGNMASAVVKGLYNSCEKFEFLTYTPSYTRANNLAKEVDGVAVKDLDQLNSCDVILIGCKPQQFGDLVKSLKNSSSFNCSNKWFISMMAAISVKKIKELLECVNVTRIMPSIPMELKSGITLIYDSSKGIRDDFKISFYKGLEDSSKVYNMDSETQFDKVTTISSSGTAYIYYITKVFQEKLVDFGLDSNTSRDLVIQLLKGSNNIMANNKDIPLDELIDNVTSKKGVTIEAINSFNSLEIDKSIKKSIDKAVIRSLEIATDLS